MVISITYRRRSTCPLGNTENDGHCARDMLKDGKCIDLERMTALLCKFKPKEE